MAGELLEYIHMPYARTYETEVVLEIQNGKVVDEPSVIQHTSDSTVG